LYEKMLYWKQTQYRSTTAMNFQTKNIKQKSSQKKNNNNNINRF